MLQIVDALPAEIAVLDGDGHIVATNERWSKVASQGGLGDGAPVRWNYLDECTAAAARDCAEAGEIGHGIRQVLGGQTELFVRCYPCPIGGQHRWYQVAVVPAPAGSLGRAIVMHTDVTALQHDPLTGLANRLLFEAQLELILGQVRRTGLTAGVLLVDLDRFKPINDTLGHRAGDRLLVETARRLRSCIRSGDLAARLGGDEFAIAMSPTSETGPADALAARVVAALRLPYALTGRPTVVGASVGLALWPRDAQSADDLLECADRALYAAKAAGGACYRQPGRG